MSLRFFAWPVPHLNRIGRAAVNLIFPPCCAFCRVELENNDAAPQLCPDGVQNVFTPQCPACPHCGAYRVVVDTTEGRCVECRNKQLRFDVVRSLGEYDGLLQEAVLRMKYEQGESLGAAVGRRMADWCDHVGYDDRPDLVTCIPKYWTKRLVTGVNSAEILMSALAQRAKLTALADLLFCRRNINKQSMLSPEQRRRNVRGAWALTAGYDISHAHILLVDDIMTTGATANEAARALRNARARRVTVAVVGRALNRGR